VIAFRRIHVPYDFSMHSTKALQIAAGLLGPGGRLVVLNVVAQVLPVSDAAAPGVVAFIPAGELVAKSQRELARVIAKAIPPKVRGRVQRKVVVGDPHLRILAEARKVDLIVMPTAGRTGFAHLLIGSVAEKIVRHSPVPVLTIRPGGRRGATRKAARSGASRRTATSAPS
jgi:nucleotide-binding universal stress UspA family protein